MHIILFSFIEKLIPFFKIPKKERKKEYGNNSKQSRSLHIYIYIYNFISLYLHENLNCSKRFIRRGIEIKIKSSHGTMARNLDEESRGRPSLVLEPRGNKRGGQVGGKGIVDRAVEISGRIIGVRLN